jgi:uncharacterized ParB-like nuclease family protein
VRLLALLLEKIRLDPQLQMRADLDPDTVAEYADALLSGCHFPPLVVFRDPQERVYWLADGWHRWHAYHRAGRKAAECDVRDGTRRDALLFAVGANVTHGRRRTRADCRRAVAALLDVVEWCKWSHREIARRCGVTDYLVRTMREERQEAAGRLARRGEQVYETSPREGAMCEQIADAHDAHDDGPTWADCPQCQGAGAIAMNDPRAKHAWRITLPDGRTLRCRANTKGEARALGKAYWKMPDRLPVGAAVDCIDGGQDSKAG